LAAGESREGTPYDLLKAVESRLRERLEYLNAGNCFITDEPIPPNSYFPTGKLVCTICLLDGTFDGGFWVGGGPAQLTEHSNLVVTLCTRSKLDQPPRAEQALLNADFGILTKHKPRILQALLVDDPQATTLRPWVPLNADGNQFLLDAALRPTRSRGPTQLTGGDWLGLELHFAVAYDWDLSFET
jgi:hypothetical protein